MAQPLLQSGPKGGHQTAFQTMAEQAPLYHYSYSKKYSEGFTLELESLVLPKADIAILIKHPQLFDQARQCAQALIDAGARVVLYHLGPNMTQDDQGALILFLKRMTRWAACYTADPHLAERCGLWCMPVDRLAQRLIQADRVIPF